MIFAFGTSSAMSLIPMLLILLAAWILFRNSVKIARGDEFITLERRWFGKQMPDGRTIALKDEVGIQARTLGPGTHFLMPFIYKATKNKIITIGTTQVGIVTAVSGQPIQDGKVFADPVECSLFQDGEAFLNGKGQKGLQLTILPPGQHRINPALFKVEIKNAFVIDEGQIGQVEALAGEKIPQGRIFAEPVDCNDFLDAKLFLTNKGQKGPQIPVLGPGIHRLNTALFTVEVKPATVIPGGKIGLVVANDGQSLAQGRITADVIEGHKNFEDGKAFIDNKGQRGRQLQVLMPGTYRINTNMFTIAQIVDWVSIGNDQIGVVTVLDGKAISDGNSIAAKDMPLDKHANFQNPAAYLKEDGEKGLQIPVLRAGSYAINPWFADVKKEQMVDVKIGTCIVITSFVGDEGADVKDQSDASVNAKIVENGKKGIWKDPYGAGKHPINLAVRAYTEVPSNQLLLDWADDTQNDHGLDAGLNSIALRTADGFTAKLAVRVNIHIAIEKASMVIANQGSVKNMISQVIEPLISSHFRNAAQSVKALDLLTKRSELQTAAEEHIRTELAKHNIECKMVMIADIALPEELTKTVSDRQLAEQRKTTYTVQTDAQNERAKLESSTALADQQKEIVQSNNRVTIEKNLANAAVEKATGEGNAAKAKAAGEADAKKTIGQADADVIKNIGSSEADIIKQKGEAVATSYEKQNKAMGEAGSGFVQFKIMELISAGKLKLIPDNLIMGGGGNGGGSNLENFIGINLLEKLTGKNMLQSNPATSEEDINDPEKKK